MVLYPADDDDGVVTLRLANEVAGTVGSSVPVEVRPRTGRADAAGGGVCQLPDELQVAVD